MSSTIARTTARRLPEPTRRRALELLADCPQEGCTEALMLAHCFTVEQLAKLVRAGLATATAERVAGSRKMEVAALRITGQGAEGAGKGAAMNWRRGLSRLWIVGTALFVLAIAVISYSEIKQQFEQTSLQQYVEATSELLVPVLCEKVRGVAGRDYITQLEGSKDHNCWYTMSKFRPLFPEYNDLSDRELSRKLYAARGMPSREPPNPWVTLGTWASIAVGIPLVVLVLGASLVWAFSGFSAKQP